MTQNRSRVNGIVAAVISAGAPGARGSRAKDRPPAARKLAIRAFDNSLAPIGGQEAAKDAATPGTGAANPLLAPGQ